jgi:predicted branched-subunit amino acid permease
MRVVSAEVERNQQQKWTPGLSPASHTTWQVSRLPGILAGVEP